MKIVISNKIYFKPDKELWDYCEKQTTYEIYASKMAKFPTIYKNSGEVASGTCWIPNTRIDLLDRTKTEYTVVDKRIIQEAVIPKPSFTLYPEQQELYDKIDDTCIVNGNPGFGKTILGLALAHKLQMKTLVVCTTLNIRDMWVKEIQKWFGFTPGIIGAKRFETDTPIVVGNIQSLNKVSNEVSKMFGLVIVDEVHHCVATTFSNLITKSHARYKIGLSGTIKRKDGLQVMFKDYFGFKIFTPRRNNVVEPIIHRYNLNLEVAGGQNIPWATRASELYDNQKYIDTLQNLCKLYISQGHKVLFVHERTESLLKNHEAMLQSNILSHLMIGTTSSDDREYIMETVPLSPPCIINAARSIFSEGVSLNELSCIVVANLIGDNESLIEQLAGRIQRIVEDKEHPIYVDLVLKGKTGKSQANYRYNVFAKNGWEVIDMTPDKIKELEARN